MEKNWIWPSPTVLYPEMHRTILETQYAAGLDFSLCFHLVSFNKLGQLSRYSDYATGLTTEELWFDSRHGQEIYVCSKTFSTALRPT
jgi:hypothetical protein